MKSEIASIIFALRSPYSIAWGMLFGLENPIGLVSFRSGRGNILGNYRERIPIPERLFNPFLISLELPADSEEGGITTSASLVEDL
jgi:hypothetical protein